MKIIKGQVWEHKIFKGKAYIEKVIRMYSGQIVVDLWENFENVTIEKETFLKEYNLIT